MEGAQWALGGQGRNKEGSTGFQYRALSHQPATAFWPLYSSGTATLKYHMVQVLCGQWAQLQGTACPKHQMSKASDGAEWH